MGGGVKQRPIAQRGHEDTQGLLVRPEEAVRARLGVSEVHFPRLNPVRVQRADLGLDVIRW